MLVGLDLHFVETILLKIERNKRKERGYFIVYKVNSVQDKIFRHLIRNYKVLFEKKGDESPWLFNLKTYQYILQKDLVVNRVNRIS